MRCEEDNSDGGKINRKLWGETERGKKSRGCDGEKTERKKWRKKAKGSREEAGSGAFSRGARQCKWPVSGSQRGVQRPLLISRGSKMVDLTS